MVAPEKSDISSIFGEVARDLDYLLSFLSTESIYKVHQQILLLNKPDPQAVAFIFSTKNEDISMKFAGLVN